MKTKLLLSVAMASVLLAAGAQARQVAGTPPPVVTPRVSVTTEEFNGPFPSWGNVKAYGAVGDGVADDTAALQKALDSMNLFIVNKLGWKLEKIGSPAVMYLPAGTYRISKTLLSTNAYGISIIGEDPSKTRIVWNGPAGGTMLQVDGVYGGKYARITWDGKSKAGIGIAHWWNQRINTQQYGGSPEHVDEVFTDMGVGIVAGCCGKSSTTASHPATGWLPTDYGNLDSEGSVKRTKFIRNSVAGVSTESFNALDWWVMDSEFTDCYRGLTNALGAGNVHSYRNLFQRSKFADINVEYVQWHSMHDNVSIGSRRFLHAQLAGNNGRPLILKNNRIVNTTNPISVSMGNLGPLMMIDNEILSQAASPVPVVEQLNNTGIPGSDIILVGNKFTVANQFSGNNPLNRVIKQDNTLVSAASISTAPPILPATPKNSNRQVFEVPLTTNPTLLSNETTASMIQAVINRAAASLDANPIVHIPRGTFTLDASLVLPPGRRIQLAGDGLATILKAGANLGANPMLRLNGPSLATVRELRFLSNDYSATAIEINKADQSGGRILLNGTMSGVSNITNLAATRVEFQHTSSIKKINATAAASVLTVGSGVIGPVAVNQNSRMLMLDTWYEGHRNDTLITGDSGTFTYLGGHIAPPEVTTSGTPAGPAITVDKFAGQFSVLGLTFDMKTPSQGILVKNEVAATKAFFYGVLGNPADLYYKRINAGGTIGFGLMKANRTVQQANYGATDNAALLVGMAQARSLVWDQSPAVIPAGATDVLLYRIRTVETGVGYRINGL